MKGQILKLIFFLFFFKLLFRAVNRQLLIKESMFSQMLNVSSESNNLENV